MKKILTLISLIAISFGFVACESLFDNLEGDKTKLSGELLAETEGGLTRMMATLYSKIPMDLIGSGTGSNGDLVTDNAVDVATILLQPCAIFANGPR